MFYTQSVKPIKKTFFKFLPLEINARSRDKTITPKFEITNTLTLISSYVQVPTI